MFEIIRFCLLKTSTSLQSLFSFYHNFILYLVQDKVIVFVNNHKLNFTKPFVLNYCHELPNYACQEPNPITFDHSKELDFFMRNVMLLQASKNWSAVNKMSGQK